MSAAPERMEKLQVSRALGNFADRTGMHAVATIANEKTILKRCAWAFLLLTALAMLGFQIHGISKKLRSHPTTTKVELISEPKATFPVITICNLNAVKRSILDYMAGEGRKSFLETLKKIKNQTLIYERLIKLRDAKTGTLPLFYDDLKYIPYYAKVLEDKGGRRFMYSYRDMVLRCQFEKEDCGYEEVFRSFFSPQFGKCLAFDFEKFTREFAPSVKFKEDITSVFELILKVHSSSYIPELGPSVGYLILLNAHGTPPIPDEEGFMVAPGFLTQFGLRKTELRRLPPPYGKCDAFISRKGTHYANMYFKTFNSTKPTQEVCLRTCEQLQVMKNCNCFSILHGNVEADAFAKFPQARNQACLSTKEYLCQSHLIKQIRSGENEYCNKMCPSPECNTTIFQVSQSISAWPEDVTLKMIQNEYELFNELPVMNASEFRRNVLKVRIKFEDLNVIVYKTEVAYDWLDFLSDLGGQGGLWLGMSVFTAFEVLVLIFDFVNLIFRNIVYYCRRKKLKTKDDGNEKDIECRDECVVE